MFAKTTYKIDLVRNYLEDKWITCVYPLSAQQLVVSNSEEVFFYDILSKARIRIGSFPGVDCI